MSNKLKLRNGTELEVGPTMFKDVGDDLVFEAITDNAVAAVCAALGIKSDKDGRPSLAATLAGSDLLKDAVSVAVQDGIKLAVAKAAPGEPTRPSFTFQQLLQHHWANDPRNRVAVDPLQKAALERAEAAVKTGFDEAIKTLNLGGAAAGLNLVPEYFATEIIEFAIGAAPTLGMVTRIPMGSMRKLSFPREKSALWLPDIYWEDYVDPTKSKTETASPEFERASLELKLYYVLWQIPHDLLLFTNTAINTFLQTRIARAIGRELERLIWLGNTSAGDPFDGVYETSGVTPVDLKTPGTLTFDDIIELEFAIEPEYWANARFVLGPGALKEIAKLKDKNDNYIWQAPVGNAPGTIHGRPYTVTSVIGNNVGGAGYTCIFYGDPALFFLGEGTYSVKVSEEVGFKENVTWWKVVGYADGFLSVPAGMAFLRLVPVS